MNKLVRKQIKSTSTFSIISYQQYRQVRQSVKEGGNQKSTATQPTASTSSPNMHLNMNTKTKELASRFKLIKAQFDAASSAERPSAIQPLSGLKRKLGEPDVEKKPAASVTQ